MSSKTAWEAALKKLSYRDYSTAEIESFLSQQEFSSQDIQSTLQRLQDYRFLSDDRLANALVRGSSHKGNRWIEQKLKKRKISESVAHTALEASSSEFQRAQEVAQKKWAKIRAKPPSEQIHKLAAFLAQRGFSPEVCWKTAKQFQSSSQESSSSIEDFL